MQEVEKLVDKLIENLKQLSKEDNDHSRENIADIGNNLLTEYFQEFYEYSADIACITGDIIVMDECEGRKEPKILHMPLQEIEKTLKYLIEHQSMLKKEEAN